MPRQVPVDSVTMVFVPQPSSSLGRQILNRKCGSHAIAVCRRLLALVSEMQEMQSATTLEDVFTTPARHDRDFLLSFQNTS